MFYFIILAIIGFILFKMRQRIIGGIVVSMVFIGVIFFSIFLLDWYVGVDLRDYVNISWYDKTIQNPVKVGEELAGAAKEEVLNYNQQISDVGGTIDKKLGISQDSKGIWQEESDSEEPGKEDTTISEEESSNETNTGWGIFSKKEDSADYTGEDWVIGFDEVEEVAKAGGFTRNDKNLLKTVSPHNPGVYEGEGIKVTTTRDTIIISKK